MAKPEKKRVLSARMILIFVLLAGLGLWYLLSRNDDVRINESQARELVRLFEEEKFARLTRLFDRLTVDYGCWSRLEEPYARLGLAMKKLNIREKLRIQTPTPGDMQTAKMFRDLARRITKGTTNQKEKISRLFEWVVRHVDSQTGGDAAKRKGAIPALPETVLMRGYGLCDRSAWVLAELIRAGGMQSYILYLRTPETGVSPHTIAAAEIDGKLVLLDPFVGLPFMDPNVRTGVTFQQALTHKNWIDQWRYGDARYPFAHRTLKKATLFVPAYPFHLLPTTGILQDWLGAAGLKISLYRDPMIEVSHLAELADRKQKKPPADKESPSGVMLWPYPIRLLRGGGSGNPWRLNPKQYPRSSALAAVRKIALLGRSKEALIR